MAKVTVPYVPPVIAHPLPSRSAVPANREAGSGLARNIAERDFLRRRAEGIAVSGPAVRTLGAAAAEFLRRDDLDGSTIRSYGQTLRRLCLSLGEELPLDAVTGDQVARVFTTAWGAAAARTWNRHRSAMRSFGAWASATDLAVALDRRAEAGDSPQRIGTTPLETLWQRTDLPVRERGLWQLLYESTARVSTVLALNVEDLDLDDRRARVGDTWVNWRAGTARLLPELVAGRTHGPLFLADRRPGPGRLPNRPACARTPGVGACPTPGPSACSSRPRRRWTRPATVTRCANSGPADRSYPQATTWVW